jgi:cobalt-zinc-cadmium efflux system membrane fusion protein
MKNHPTSKKQWAAIAALVAAGLLGGTAILRTPDPKPGDEHGHGEAQGHAEAHGAGEKPGAAHAEHGQEPAPGREAHAGGQDHGHEDEHREASGPASATGERAGLAAGAHGPGGGTTGAMTPAAPGRLALSEEQMKAAGIGVEAAGPALIRSTLQLPGQIRFNEDRTAHVVPRVAGVVESVPASLGQTVRRGQVLAVISSAAVSELRSELQAARRREALARATHEREQRLWQEKISPQQDVLQAEQALREAEIAVANAQQKLQAIGAGATAGASALNRFELRAPFNATIVEKHLALGEAVREDSSVFTLSDLSSVWAEVDVAAQDLPRVRVGAPVTVRSSAFEQSAAGRVAYVGALLGEQTRTAKARITLANPQAAWRPGLFVTVELLSGEASAPVTVAAEAVQQLDARPVVFQQVPGGFVPRPVELGRGDGRRVEVLRGLEGGAPYAATGAFVLKSEAGKGSATHTH